MPIYEFDCRDCHDQFEVLRPITAADDSPPPCEYCGSSHTARKLSNIIAVFGSDPNRKVLSNGNSCGSCASVGGSACNSCNGGR